MVRNDKLVFSKMIRLGKTILWYLLLNFVFTSGYSQQVRDLHNKIADNFNHNSFYTTLNLCREVIHICETIPEPECWYTNIMKDIYHYKGLAEFEIYKKELKKKRLSDAIESLTLSYNLYRDPEVQFLSGYLKSLNALVTKKKTDLNGLVIGWESLLNLYANNGWKISADIVVKIKLYLGVAEKFTEPIPKEKYTGAFAKFIIVMACDLAERGNLSEPERKYFEQIRLKYHRDEGRQWQKWRSNVIQHE